MRTLFRIAALALLLAAAAPLQSAWSADKYPDRPVKFIVPFGAGGPADVFARDVAQHLSESMKGSFVKLSPTPENSTLSPTLTALAGSGSWKFSVASGLVGSSTPNTSVFGRSGGSMEMMVPLKFFTPLAPPGISASLTLLVKNWSPWSVVKLCCRLYHSERAGSD